MDTTHNLPQELQEAVQAEDLTEACQRVSFGPAQDRPWLVVNDLGAERLTDWAAEASARGLRLSSAEVLALQLTLEGLIDLADSIARHPPAPPPQHLRAGRRPVPHRRGGAALVGPRAVAGRVPADRGLDHPSHVHPLPDDALAVLARQQAENAHQRDLSAIARTRAIARVRETVAEEAPGTGGSWEDTAADTLAENDLDDLTGERLAETAGLAERALRDLLADMGKWEATMRRFYQLLRHLVHELCRPDGWPLEPHLLAVVNALNVNRDGKPHAVEFKAFQGALQLLPERTHLLTGACRAP